MTMMTVTTVNYFRPFWGHICYPAGHSAEFILDFESSGYSKTSPLRTLKGSLRQWIYVETWCFVRSLEKPALNFRPRVCLTFCPCAWKRVLFLHWFLPTRFLDVYPWALIVPAQQTTWCCRYNKVTTMGPGQALMWGISSKPINTLQYGLGHQRMAWSVLHLCHMLANIPMQCVCPCLHCYAPRNMLTSKSWATSNQQASRNLEKYWDI